MENSFLQQLTVIAQKYPALRLFLLFGSRAQGVARKESDWDFGYIGEGDFDSLPLYTELSLLLKTDSIDLVDLRRASALLRFRAVRDGKLVYEASKGQYQRFWLEVVNFWCENEELFKREYKGILEELG